MRFPSVLVVELIIFFGVYVGHVDGCHTVRMFPNIQNFPLFNEFSPILSQIPLFASLVPRPPPVHRDNVIKTGNCAGGEIIIITVFPWRNATVERNMRHMDYELGRLQKYSGISTNEFCPEITKTPIQHGSNFAVVYRFPYLTSTCDRVRLFVRNAVSWSSEVSRARVICECDKIVDLVRQ